MYGEGVDVIEIDVDPSDEASKRINLSSIQHQLELLDNRFIASVVTGYLMCSSFTLSCSGRLHCTTHVEGCAANSEEKESSRQQ